MLEEEQIEAAWRISYRLRLLCSFSAFELLSSSAPEVVMLVVILEWQRSELGEQVNSFSPFKLKNLFFFLYDF